MATSGRASDAGAGVAPALDKPVLPPVKKAVATLSAQEQKRRAAAFKALTKASKKGSLSDLRKAFSTITGGVALSDTTEQPVLALVDEALEIACVNDRVEIVQWLVAFGADPKLPLGHSAYPGVVHAAAAGSMNVLKYLRGELESELDFRVGREGSTALHLAAEARHHSQQTYTPICEWLIKNGVDVNVTRPKDMMTPLHIAARAGKDKIVQMLLDNDADPTLGCMDIGLAAEGVTPLMLAQRGTTKTGFSGHDRAVKHLTRAVAEKQPAETPPVKSSRSRTRSRRKSLSRQISVSADIDRAESDVTMPDDDTASLSSSRRNQTSRELTAIELQELREKNERDSKGDTDLTLSDVLREEQDAKEALAKAQLRASEAKKLAKAVRKSMHKSPRDRDSYEGRQRANTVSVISTDLNRSASGADLSTVGAGRSSQSLSRADVFCVAKPSSGGESHRGHSAPERIGAGGVRTEKMIESGSGESGMSSPTRRMSRSDSDSGLTPSPGRVRQERAMSATAASGRRVQSAGPGGRSRRATQIGVESSSRSDLSRSNRSLRDADSASTSDASFDGGLNTSWNSESMSDAMMDSCATCGKQCDIQLCVQCLSIGYCSRACQKVDWKQHKNTCRPKSAQKSTPITSSDA